MDIETIIYAIIIIGSILFSVIKNIYKEKEEPHAKISINEYQEMINSAYYNNNDIEQIQNSNINKIIEVEQINKKEGIIKKNTIKYDIIDDKVSSVKINGRKKVNLRKAFILREVIERPDF